MTTPVTFFVNSDSNESFLCEECISLPQYGDNYYFEVVLLREGEKVSCSECDNWIECK